MLQEDKLHLFRRSDEVVPMLSIPLKQCEVRRANKKTKKFCFEVNVPSEKEDYCFAADDEKEMLSWIRMLRAIAEEEDVVNRFVQEFLLPNMGDFVRKTTTVTVTLIWEDKVNLRGAENDKFSWFNQKANSNVPGWIERVPEVML